MGTTTQIRSVCLVSRRATDYRRFLKWVIRRKREALPAKPTSTTSIGKLIERPVLHVIKQTIDLDRRRVLRFNEQTQDRKPATKFRELDAVHFVNAESAVLYELKHISSDLKSRLEGAWQVGCSARVLRHAVPTVRTRLVYIAPSDDPLRQELPSVDITDMHSNFGVIWLTPEQVQESAKSIGVTLPSGWDELDERFGVRRFAG